MNLLSVNLLLLLCALCTGLVLWLSLQAVQDQRGADKRKKKRRQKRSAKKATPLTLSTRAKQMLRAWRGLLYAKVIVAFGGGLTLALLTTICLHVAFAGNVLPSLLWLMLLPTGVALIYMFTNLRRDKARLIVSSAAVVACTLFSMGLTNYYYGYYPTVASIFGKGITTQTITLRANPASSHLVHSATIVENSYEPGSDQPVKGKLYSLTIPGPSSHFEARTAIAYVPPAGLDKDTAPALPVVILLAGSPGDPVDWVYGGGMESTLNEFAARHKGLAPIVVAVDHNGSRFNDTECLDSPRGNAETYLTQDVPAYIKSTFHVSSQPQAWAIGGLSDGGMCGLMLTLAHPAVFKAFLDFGGETGPEVGNKDQTVHELFGDSLEAWTAHDPASLLSAHTYPDIGGWFGVGDSDSAAIVEGQKSLYQQALSAHIDANIELVPGGQHTFYVWRQNFQDALPWLSNRFGLTLCETRCQQN